MFKDLDEKAYFRHVMLFEFKKEAVQHILALFLGAHVKNGSSGAEMSILASLMNRIQDDLQMLMRTVYLKKYGKIRGEVLLSLERLWKYQGQQYIIILKRLVYSESV